VQHYRVFLLITQSKQSCEYQAACCGLIGMWQEIVLKMVWVVRSEKSSSYQFLSIK